MGEHTWVVGITFVGVSSSTRGIVDVGVEVIAPEGETSTRVIHLFKEGLEGLDILREEKSKGKEIQGSVFWRANEFQVISEGFEVERKIYMT